MSRQPVDTYYDGYWFRSRTEARWAVFWKTLGLPFEYETEGYDLGEIWYLPDYYVPAWKMFVEIKAGALDESEIRKCELLHRRVGRLRVTAVRTTVARSL